jgi:hypothetical protein
MFNNKKNLITERYSKLLELQNLAEYLYEDGNLLNEWDGNIDSLGTFVTKTASALSPELRNELNLEINKILNTGRGNGKITNEKEEQQPQFRYITSVIAALYRNASEDEKINIRNYISTAFIPYTDKGAPTKFARTVAKNAGIPYDISTREKNGDLTTAATTYFDIIIDAINDITLDQNFYEKYDANQSVLGQLLLRYAVNRTRDLLRNKQYKKSIGVQHSTKGGQSFSTVSGNQQLGSGEEGDEVNTLFSTTPAAKEVSYEEKEEKSKIVEAITDFVMAKAGFNPSWIELYTLLTGFRKNSETGKVERDETNPDGLSIPEIAEITGKQENAIRQLKKRFEDHMTRFVEDGSFGEFIWRRTHSLVPFQNDRFTISTIKGGRNIGSTSVTADAENGAEDDSIEDIEDDNEPNDEFVETPEDNDEWIKEDDKKRHKQYISIIREYYKKLLQLNELDVIDDKEGEPEFQPEPSPDLGGTVDLSEPEQKAAREIGVEEYDSLGTSIANVSKELSPESKQKADQEISRVLDTGLGTMSYEKNITADKSRKDMPGASKGIDKNKKNAFDYVTSVLAALYKEVGEKQKKNIRDFMFAAYNPYMEGGSSFASSKFARAVATKSIPYDITGAKTSKSLEYLEKVSMGIIEAIDYALESYNPNGSTFGWWLFTKSISNTLDAIQKKDSTSIALSTVSGDEPTGGQDEEGEETFISQLTEPEEGLTQEQRDNIKAVARAVSGFVKEKLDNPQYQSWYTLYDQILNQGLGLDVIADKSGTDVGGVRIKKMRVEKFLSQFVKNGDLLRYIKDKTGINAKFKDDKFRFSAKDGKETPSEAKYIFKTGVKRNQQTGKIEADPHNPEGGEWVEVSKYRQTKDSPRDTLGDVAFGTGEEEPEEENPISEIKNIIKETLETT